MSQYLIPSVNKHHVGIKFGDSELSSTSVYIYVVWWITELQGAIFQLHSSEEWGYPLPAVCMVFALQQLS